MSELGVLSKGGEVQSRLLLLIKIGHVDASLQQFALKLFEL